MVDTVDPARKKEFVLNTVRVGYDAEAMEFAAFLDIPKTGSTTTLEIDGFTIDVTANPVNEGAFTLHLKVQKPEGTPWLVSWSIFPPDLPAAFEGYRSGHIWEWPWEKTIENLPLYEEFPNQYRLIIWEP